MRVIVEVDRSGFGELALAGAAGSHAGEPEHVASVRKVLAAAGLDESALQCPAELPLNAEARRAAEAPAAVYHNCSGKHAYMLAGAVVRGWEIERYTEPEHPLQAVVSDTVADFTGGRLLSKAGAEGASAAVNLDTNQGVAVKVLDGAVRARGPALVSALTALGWLDERELEALLPVVVSPVFGGGEQVGTVR